VFMNEEISSVQKNALHCGHSFGVGGKYAWGGHFECEKRIRVAVKTVSLYFLLTYCICIQGVGNFESYHQVTFSSLKTYKFSRILDSTLQKMQPSEPPYMIHMPPAPKTKIIARTMPVPM
jgi:hypothetical protein